MSNERIEWRLQVIGTLLSRGEDAECIIHTIKELEKFLFEE